MEIRTPCIDDIMSETVCLQRSKNNEIAELTVIIIRCCSDKKGYGRMIPIFLGKSGNRFPRQDMAAKLVDIPVKRRTSAFSESRYGDIVLVLIHIKGTSLFFYIIKNIKFIISQRRRKRHKKVAEIFLQCRKRRIFRFKSIVSVTATAHETGKSERCLFVKFRRER